MFEELIDAVRARSPLQRTAAEMASLLARACAARPPCWPLVTRPGSYTRTCAYRDELVEILVLNWAAGAASAIHDHGKQHCWMLVLDGELLVDDYQRLDRADVPGYAHVAARESRVLKTGGVDLRSGPFDLHRVAAYNEMPAISLHVYSGPLQAFQIYDEQADRCQVVRGTYDDVLSTFADAAPG